jgi:hypothetical protein
MKPRSTNGRCNIHRPIKSIIRDAKTCTRRGHCCSTRVRCRISAGHAAVLGEGAEHRAGLVEANAREQQPLDVQAVPDPQFDFEEVAPIGDQRIVGVFVEEAARGARSTGEPKWLAFWLKARPENRGVHRVGEAVAHVRRTFILDVHVEFVSV